MLTFCKTQLNLTGWFVVFQAKSRVLKQQYVMPQSTPVYVMLQPDAGLPIMEGNVRLTKILSSAFR